MNHCVEMCKSPCGLKLHQTKVGTCAEFSGIPAGTTQGKMQEEPHSESSHRAHSKPPSGSSLKLTQTIITLSGQVAPSQQGDGVARPIVSSTPGPPSLSARTERRINWYPSGWFCLRFRAAVASTGRAVEAVDQDCSTDHCWVQWTRAEKAGKVAG